MKTRFAPISLILFLVSLSMLWLLTLFESLLVGMSTNRERIISVVLLIVPSVAGVIFGILSLRQKEPRPWIAVAGLLLNGFFALFNLLVLFFSG